MKSQIVSRIIYLLLILGFFLGLIVIYSTQNSFGGGDNFSHYKFAHWGWRYPSLLFDHWGKPVFTILASPFAQTGINGIRVYNLLVGLLTALIIGELARHFQFKNRPLGVILVLFTPIYFIMMFTSLTEVTFSFFLTAGILLFFKEKYLWAAVIWSFLPIIRTEGIVLFPLFVLALGIKKQYFSIPLLTAGFWIISLIGYFFFDEFWWLFTKLPYVGNAKNIYGSGSLLHFVRYTKEILGYPLAGLFIVGLVIVLGNWLTTDKRKLTSSFFFLILIPGSFLTFLVAHSFSWWLGVGKSLGLIRVMASVTPMVALTALIGYNFLEKWLIKKNKIVSRIFTVLLLTWIVLYGVKSHIGGFQISHEDLLMDEAGDYILNNNLDEYKVFYFSPHLMIKLGIDPFNHALSNEGLPNKLHPALTIPDNSIIVWDAHFGPNEGNIPLEKLLNNDRLVLLKEFHPDPPFKVLGGYDYGVYIFQKRLHQEKSNSNVEGLIEEYHLDFEESDNDTSVIAHSGEKSLSVLYGQAYINLIEMPVIQLAPQRQPIKIEVTGAVYAATNINNSSPALVCSMDDSGKNLMYEAFKPVLEKAAAWDTFSHTFNIYVIPSNTAHLKLYLWNKDQATFNLDDVHIKISELDPGK